MVITNLVGVIFVHANNSGPPRWYSGYYYSCGSYAPYGVSGEILTTDMSNIPKDWTEEVEFGCEWVSIILNYDMMWWVQVGYIKRWDKNSGDYIIRFYYEKNDTRGHSYIETNIAPSISEIYEYIIVHSGMDSDNYYWQIEIRRDTIIIIYDELITIQADPVDLQAQVEITDPNIHVDPSYFGDLRYFEGRSWPLWDRHVAYASYIFILYFYLYSYLYEVNDYEFVTYTYN